MKPLNIILISLCAFLSLSLQAQEPQLEQEILSAEAGLPHWIPFVGLTETEGIRLDYDGDGNREIVFWLPDGDNILLIARSSADPEVEWTFHLTDKWVQPDWQFRDLMFLGFQDIDGNGTVEALIGKRNRPLRINGLNHVAIASLSADDFFNCGPDRILKDVSDWDDDGQVELVFQNEATGNIELWGQ